MVRAMVQATALPLSDGTIDLRAGCVRRGCGEFRLTAKERDLLCYLQPRSHRVVARDELMREVWEYRDCTRSRAVDFTVHRLRTKIEIDPTEPRHLLTVHGVGYQLVPAAGEPRSAETHEVPSGLVALLAAAMARDVDDVEAELAVSERLVALVAERGGHAARADGRRWLVAFADTSDAVGVAQALAADPGHPAAALAVAVSAGVPRCVREPVSGRWDYRGPAVERVHDLLRTAPPGRVVVDGLVLPARAPGPRAVPTNREAEAPGPRPAR